MLLLQSGLKTAAGVSITYVRGAVSVPLTAWVGRTLFSRQPTEPGGAAVVWGDRDYLISVADLTAKGISPPNLGDRITETMQDGTVATFEVQKPDTNEPAWRYSDQSRQIFRIHCKRVA